MRIQRIVLEGGVVVHQIELGRSRAQWAESRHFRFLSPLLGYNYLCDKKYPTLDAAEQGYWEEYLQVQAEDEGECSVHPEPPPHEW